MADINPRDRSSEWTFLETLEGAGVLSPSVDLGRPEMHFGNPEAGLNSDSDLSNLQSLDVGNARQFVGLRSDSPVPAHSTAHSSRSNLSAAATGGNHFSTEDEDDVLLFVDKPNARLYCLLCHKVFKDPVIVSCGHTFCKRCVIYQENINCPVDNINIKVVVSNLAVAEQIGELLVHCRYGVEPMLTNSNSAAANNCTEQYQVNPHGCPVTIRASARRAHEAECDYKPVHCPNNPECPLVLKKDLADHVSHCDHALCPKHQFGCQFHGTATELASHVEQCPYEAMKHYIHRTEGQFSELMELVQQKDQEINFLRAMLGQLSTKVESLEKTVEDCVDRLESFDTEISAIHDKFQVVLTSQTGVFDPQQIFKCKGTFVGHSGPVWCLCVHQDYLFSGSSDKTIKVWDTSSSYKCLKTLEGHQGIVLSLAIYGNRLFSSSQDCYILVWNLESFDRERTIVAHDNPVGTLIAAKGMLFGGSLKVIKVWDVSTMQLKRSITGLNHWVRALTTSHNYLYGGSYQTIKVWDVDTLDCVRQLETPGGGSVYSIAITSHHILCGTYENCIHVWEVGTYNEVTTLVGHLGTVYALAVLNLPTGTKIFSASYDRSLRVWSMDNMLCTQTLVRHEGSVACLAVSKGQIFSGAMDSTVKVWR